MSKTRSLTNYLSKGSIDHLLGIGAVAELEGKARLYYNSKYALSVSNATIGLLAVSLALELKGATVVSSPLTFGGTIAGLLLLGNNIVFADVDRHHTLSAAAVETLLAD